MSGLLSRVFESAKDDGEAGLGRIEAVGERSLDQSDGVADRSESRSENASERGAEDRGDAAADRGEERAETNGSSEGRAETEAEAEFEADLGLDVEHESEVTYTDANGDTHGWSTSAETGFDVHAEASLSAAAATGADIDGI